MSYADIARGPRTRARPAAGPDPRLHHVSRRFHPSFRWPRSPHDIILETFDGISFYADLRILGVYSPFFADLSEIPSPHPQGQFHHIIPLPNATSAGLIIFLLAVDRHESFPFPSIPSEVLMAGILDAVQMSDPYDIPMFADLTPKVILGAFMTYPFMQFALAAAMRDEDAAVSASRATLPLRIESMPREVGDFLLERAPRYHARLLHFHQHVRPRVLSFRQALVINEEIRGTMRFDEGCLRNGCPAVRFMKGNFHELREEVVTAMWNAWTGQADRWRDDDVVETVQRMVHCKTCGRRIGEMVVRAVEKHEHALELKDSI